MNIKKKKNKHINFMVPFSWMGFNNLKHEDLLQGVCFQSPGILGIHSINFRKMKGLVSLRAAQWF